MDIAAMGTIDARTYRSGARRCRDDRTPRRTLAVGQWKMVVLPDQRAGRRNLRQWQALQRIVLRLQWAVDGLTSHQVDLGARKLTDYRGLIETYVRAWRLGISTGTSGSVLIAIP